MILSNMNVLTKNVTRLLRVKYPMPKSHHVPLTLLITLITLFSVTNSFGKNKPEGQLGAAIEWIPVPETTDQFYMIQRTTDGKLMLTPNESFFPKLGLRLEGTGEVPDVDLKLNGGKSFKSITKWSKSDQAEWGLWLEQTGKLQLRIWMSNTGKQGQYTVSFGNQKKKFTTRSVGDDPRAVADISFNTKKAGRHSLVIMCDNESRGAKTQLYGIEITGAAAKKSAVLRKRWRPAAAHARFSSSHNPQNVRLWIFEMDAKPGDLNFYSPMTTPFGYYGPTWQANGVVNSGMNFSLWSFGRGQQEPPIEQLSHLIAIGNRQAKFSGFDHEGTGVKIRGWEPLKGRQGQKQAFALRVEPGDVYDTYFTYYFDHKEGKWHLFGVGNKIKKKNRRFTGLTVGSFVEVPGPPPSQRTGAYHRRMRYRGWFVDGKGKLHPVDQMSTGDIVKKTDLTYTNRGVTEDGRFYLETGGWTFRKAPKQKHVTLKPSRKITKVDFLDGDDLKFLQTVPCEITGKKIKQTTAGVEVSFHIRHIGKNPTVKLYWGNKEGLTFADRWTNNVSVNKIKEGNNKFIIRNAPSGKPLFVRLLLTNNEGQFWSRQTEQLLIN